VGFSLGSVLLAKFLAEADQGLHGPNPVVTGAASAAAAVGAHGAAEVQQQVAAGAIPGGVTATVGEINPWCSLSGSGLVAAALVSAPVCLHSTNSRLAQLSPNIFYNFAVAYK
jgi:hypothetical protein